MVFLEIFGILVLAIVVVLALYALVLRTRSHRWGATDTELHRSLPGDDLVLSVKVGYTQAITIGFPPEKVWPWIVQIEYQRGGWYTYDWIYKLLGAAEFRDGNRSADRIIPELQDLQIGDSVKIFEQASFEVVALEPARVLILLARSDLETGQSFELSGAIPAKFLNQSWVFYLEESDIIKSRLIVRWRGDYSPGLANTLGLGISTDAGAMIMQPKMLKGIKARAEAMGRP